MSYDVVVVGGGTAGCILAARLSQADGRSVLLLEAGPDYPTPDELPPDVRDGSAPTLDHDWGFEAHAADGSARSVRLPRGRLIGGCSSTNAGMLLRAWPADFDGWAARGNPGWAYADVLPTLRALESDGDFPEAPWHGDRGPVPVTRPHELSAVQQAFLDAAVALGHQPVDDHNRPGAVGAGPMPRNVQAGVRMSTALTHLAGARGRAWLTIRADTLVDRVQVGTGRAVGVRLVGGEVIGAGAVVLCAGSYASPAILQRSGIGDPRHLGECGIPVTIELGGVGANLIDHPLVPVDVPARPSGSRPEFQVLLTLRTRRASAEAPPDVHVFVAGPYATDQTASGGVLGIVTGLLAVRSRGTVRVRSRDPADAPLIDVAHLRDPEDLDRMVDATLLARRLALTRPLAEHVAGPELAPGDAIADEDRDALASSIRGRVGTYHHPVGTCAMGPDPDAGAVVDALGAVYGVDRLWVVDASIMPTIPAANTNLSTIMVAEHLAARLADV